MQSISIALWLLPLDKLFGILGTNEECSKRVTGTEKEDILWSVRASIPFSLRAKCVVQGLTAERLLRQAGFPVVFRVGVNRQEVFRAHAWVEDESGILIGETDDELQPLSSLSRNKVSSGSLKFLL